VYAVSFLSFFPTMVRERSRTIRSGGVEKAVMARNGREHVGGDNARKDTKEDQREIREQT
jgi:hypothetical protein